MIAYTLSEGDLIKYQQIMNTEVESVYQTYYLNKIKLLNQLSDNLAYAKYLKRLKNG